MSPAEFETQLPASLLATWRQNTDLSWCAMTAVKIGSTTISVDTPICRNLTIEGIDVARALDRAAAVRPELVIRWTAPPASTAC